MTHEPTAPPSLDTIVRSRLRDLLAREGVPISRAASAAGWHVSTIHRRLHLDPDSEDRYRPLRVNDLDDLMAALDLPAQTVLDPVLLPGDEGLLSWVAMRTPAGLPSTAMVADLASVEGVSDIDDRVERMYRQGLLVICGDVEDETTWHLRLTPAGQRAIS